MSTKKDNKVMNINAIREQLNSFPDIICEKEDIICAMKDEAEFSRAWVNDGLLRRYIKETGDKRLDVRTRKLIKIKSYNTYIDLSNQLRKSLQKQKKELLSEIEKE